MNYIINNNHDRLNEFSKFQILGINDDQDSCDCCGKKNLKRVVWLENMETGDVSAYGTTCAAKLQKITVRQQKANEKTFEETQIANAKAEIAPYHAAYDKVVDSAPENDFSSPGSYKTRTDYIHNHPDTVAYHVAKKEIAKKYNVPVWMVR